MPRIDESPEVIGLYIPFEKVPRHPAPTYGPENNATEWCYSMWPYSVVEERRIVEPREADDGRECSTLWLCVRPNNDPSAPPLWVILEHLTRDKSGVYLKFDYSFNKET